MKGAKTWRNFECRFFSKQKGQATRGSQYARHSTDGGHAIAALVPINDADLESMALSLSPKFQAVIERAREEYRNGTSLSADDVRRELGIE